MSKLIAKGIGVEVWLTEKPEVIVLASPTDDENDETAHSCDEMGCGACHVIWRSELGRDYASQPPAQPAWPLADQAHPPLWIGADVAEAGLLGEPAPGEASAGPAKAASPAPARTHAWRFKNGNAIVTVETGGDFDDPDGRIAIEGERPVKFRRDWPILGAEILRLAGRAQAAEAALASERRQNAELNRWKNACETARTLLAGRAQVAEAERDELRERLDAASMTADEGLEINAELTAALAALLGEPPPEPCSPGCRMPHLSAKAGEAVQAALGRWRAMENQLKDALLEHGELLADIGELKTQEASAGNYVIRSMRELRKALQARSLWRPAGQGEPGGGTAGSAIEAIDRLTAERDRLKAWAGEATGKAAKALDELAEARASARHNAEGLEAALRRLPCGHPAACEGLAGPDGDQPGCGWCADIADNGVLIDHLSRTYDHFSGGRISKPLTLPEEVFAIANDLATEDAEEVATDAREEGRRSGLREAVDLMRAAGWMVPRWQIAGELEFRANEGQPGEGS